MMLIHRFETCTDKKSSHVKGWCGSGQVRSPGDFDGLDAPESRFLSHRLVSQVIDKLANKKKIEAKKVKLGKSRIFF
jgi:hypothetical protein